LLADVLHTLHLEAGQISDTTAPSTTADYDGLWYVTDFMITITVTDDLIGVAETYCKYNNGQTQNISSHGQPRITTESANNTLEYWSVDNTGNEELPHKVLIGIKLDKSVPTLSIISPLNDFEVKLSTITVSWTGSDKISSISRYEIRLDGGSWINIGTKTTYTFTKIGNGKHTINIKAADKAGNTKQDTVNFTVSTSPLFGLGYMKEIAIIATIIILALGVALYFLKIRKH
jgi:hypothetical protein